MSLNKVSTLMIHAYVSLLRLTKCELFFMQTDPLQFILAEDYDVIGVIYLQVLSIIFFENLDLMIYKDMPVDLFLFV